MPHQNTTPAHYRQTACSCLPCCSPRFLYSAAHQSIHCSSSAFCSMSPLRSRISRLSSHVLASLAVGAFELAENRSHLPATCLNLVSVPHSANDRLYLLADNLHSLQQFAHKIICPRMKGRCPLAGQYHAFALSVFIFR